MPAKSVAKKRPNGKALRTDDVVIPDRLYFRIGDVAALCQLETYVLRFWETEFPHLAPKKSSSGQRLYRPRDVENVLRIKKLLYEEGFTIAGAREQLKLQAKSTALPFAPASGGREIKQIKAGLQEILQMLGKKK